VTGEVATLKHELRDDTVEARVLETNDLALGGLEALAELRKVLSCLGDNVIKEFEIDTTLLGCKEKRDPVSLNLRHQISIDGYKAR
jgi:hypothetical protein